MKNTLIILGFIALAGCAGPKGDSGAGSAGNDGATGPTGPEGVPVQLCASQGASTPSNLPEYALCIDGALYAVYWDRSNSWLSQLPEGTYTSTSTGLACTFVVSSNCQVTEQ